MTSTSKHFRKRDAILACLRQTKRHPSADWIYQELKPQIPDLSLGTVYRNLALFKAQGLIQSVGTVGGIERFDGDTRPHVHFVCNCCQAVSDLESVQIPADLTAEASCFGQIETCQLTFYGRCKECFDKEEAV